MLDQLSKYNVAWDSPSADSSGSMPIGNGDIGANVWVEAGGDLILLIGKTDAWDENGMLLKIGRIRVSFSPSFFEVGCAFRQTLKLETGEIEILAGAVMVRLWVDANRPVIRLAIESTSNLRVDAILEIWRDHEYAVKTQTGDLFKNLTGPDPFPTIVSPDHLFDDAGDRLVWCHHNSPREHDGFAINMRLQGLGGFVEQMQHPLLGRTFGAAMKGPTFQKVDDRTFQSAPACEHDLAIHVLTEHPSTIDRWRRSLDEIISTSDLVDLPQAKEQHDRWWREFWNRSWIIVNTPDAFHVTQGYILQRFISACSGRGAQPIKFNGSIFSVGKPDDPDFRRWGPGYWFQNVRLCYWPMLASGDFDLMQPWLKMYRDMLPMQQYRTRKYFNHGGAHFPETIMFWGAEVSGHYGWQPFAERAMPEAECAYLRYYWSCGLELIVLMLEYFEHTGDLQFASESLLPIAEAVIEFFDVHWPRDVTGKMRFDPAQSLETWHSAVNPTPEIAGLIYTVGRLLSALTPSTGRTGESWGEGLIPEQTAARWHRLLTELPRIPIGEKDGKPIILPAESFDRKKNTENPELYAVFPYRIFGLDKPDLETARNTFGVRLNREHTCWSQDEIHMSMLGLADQAKDYIVKRASPACHSESRFPAFWNSFHDWLPDQDHGGVLMFALQSMLMQCEGTKIHLLPAWPSGWDAEFKLHAPYGTIVEGSVRGGEVHDLRVTPESRRGDVFIDTRRT